MEIPKKEVASKPYGVAVVLLLWIFLKSKGYYVEIWNKSQNIFYSMKYEKLSLIKGTYSEKKFIY